MNKFYRILGLHYDATLEEVKQAYRKHAKSWHPDLFSQDEKKRSEAEEKMIEINEAYRMLLLITPETTRHKLGAQDARPEPRHASAPPERRSPGTRAVMKFVKERWYVVAGVTVVMGVVWGIMFFPTMRKSAPSRNQISTLQQSTPLFTPFFTVGSTKDDVRRTQGEPTKASDTEWEYGFSKVYFHNGQVSNWYSSTFDTLRARLLPENPVDDKGYFTVRSSKDEVLAVEGTPSEFSENIWWYGYSKVTFKNDLVVTWYSSPINPLHARLLTTSDETPKAGVLSVGMRKDDVLATLGTPTASAGSVWRYGNSMVYFNNNRIANWYESTENPFIDKTHDKKGVHSRDDAFSIGSTKDEVLSVQGTPDEFSDNIWRYGFSMVHFENDLVTQWYESPSNPLKAHKQSSAEDPPHIFTVGSSKDDVLAIQGTPTEFNDYLWRYGYSKVYFEKGRVVSWYSSPANTLNAELPSPH